jgi:hypothetical protein
MQVNIGVILQVIIALFGAFFLAFWVSLVIWTFRDVRSRSRDIFAQLLATLKKSCPNCRRLLHLKWNICPYCGAGSASPSEKSVPGLESEPKIESTRI